MGMFQRISIKKGCFRNACLPVFLVIVLATCFWLYIGAVNLPQASLRFLESVSTVYTSGNAAIYAFETSSDSTQGKRLDKVDMITKHKGKQERTAEVRNIAMRLVVNTEKQNNDKVPDLKSQESCKTRNFLVFVCSGDKNCGGLGDRQKGIISTYLLAQLMNRSFVIIHDKPCDISQYLVPNEYNWRSCYQYVYQHITEKTTLQKNASTLLNLLNCSHSNDCNKDSVIYTKTRQIWNRRIVAHPLARLRLPWALNKTIPEINKIVLAKLFQPSHLLETAIRSFTGTINESQLLICSHIRSGKNPTIPTDGDRHYFDASSISAVFSFLKKFDIPSKYVLYIATDSDSIRRQVKGNFTRPFTSSLPIVHVDKITKEQRKFACEGLFGALLDQYILSTCDVLLLTRSNMGAMAAYLSKKPQNIYLLNRKNNTIFNVTLNGIQEYFNFGLVL